MAAAWGYQTTSRNAGIVDVVWAALTGIAGVAFAASSTGLAWLRIVAACMIGVWSLRLTTYLWFRFSGQPEEGRYADLRQKWHTAAPRRFFLFFQFQALGAWWFALSVWAIAQTSLPPTRWQVGLALALWLIGISGVTLADWQLAAFKRRAELRGQTCRDGLWNYSRHPNYFFEWVHWCSYIPLAAASPYWWIPVLVALALLYLICCVTGIPPTERQAVASRGDDYRRYQRTTSPFVPWPPRRMS